MPDPIVLIEGLVARVTHRLHDLRLRVYLLKRNPFWFLFRKTIMTISDDINAVSDTLDQLTTQAPPAIQAAIAAAGSAGGDPNAAAAVTRLQASASAAVAAIQGAVPAA